MTTANISKLINQPGDYYFRSICTQSMAAQTTSSTNMAITTKTDDHHESESPPEN